MSDFCIVKNGIILSCKEDGSGYIVKISDEAYEMSFQLELQDIVYFRNCLSDHIENEDSDELNHCY